MDSRSIRALAFQTPHKRYSVLAAAESFRRMRISAVPAVQSVPQSKEVIIRSKATILNYEDIPYSSVKMTESVYVLPMPDDELEFGDIKR